MNLQIKEIQSKEVWENFLLKCKEKTFLQSFNWGEFNRLLGKKIFRLGIYKGDDLIATALLILIRAKRGSFLFLPHAPNIGSEVGGLMSDVMNVLLAKLKELAKKENASFIRIAPVLESNKENRALFKNFGFRPAPIHMHPELTWELDVSCSEQELLAGMRKTTRYLIRQAGKNEQVQIIKSQQLNDIDTFGLIYQNTKDRQKFTPFSLNYVQNEFKAFLKDNQISLFLGEYNEEVVSAGIFVFWQGKAFYHHGASLLKYPKIPVSYLLLWEAIKEAKARGCEKFNFWGIAPISSDNKVLNRNHPWAGLSLFKMGFGGYVKEYVRTQDYIINQRYWINFIIEHLRKKKRGF